MEHSLGSYPNATVLNYMHVGLIDSRTKRKRRRVRRGQIESKTDERAGSVGRREGTNGEMK